MWAMPVVAVKPDGQFGSALIGCVVGSRIGPLAQAGLDEALGLSVIRYVIRRRLAVRLFPKGRRGYGEPILDTGRREHGRCGQAVNSRP